MKKKLILFVLAFAVSGVFAQEPSETRHDISIASFAGSYKLSIPDLDRRVGHSPQFRVTITDTGEASQYLEASSDDEHDVIIDTGKATVTQQVRKFLFGTFSLGTRSLTCEGKATLYYYPEYREGGRTDLIIGDLDQCAGGEGITALPLLDISRVPGTNTYQAVHSFIGVVDAGTPATLELESRE